MLACDRASERTAGSANLYPSRASSSDVVSVDKLANAAVPDGGRKLPELPDRRAFILREEDDLCLADKILEGNIAHIGAAVGGVVPVVAHHEVMAFGHD